MNKHIFLLLIPVFIFSCTGRTILKRDIVPVPSNWSKTAKEYAPVAMWSDDFNDPDLHLLVEEALKNNYNFKAASAWMKLAMAGIKISNSSLYPQAGINAGHTRTEYKNKSTDNKSTITNLNFNVSWVPDIYEQGIFKELDIRLTLADIAIAENRLEMEKEVHDKTVRAFKILLGRYPSAELKTPDTLIEITKSVTIGLPSELLKRRPDLLAAEHLLNESEAGIALANKNLLPDIVLTGKAGKSSPELKDLLNLESLVLTIAGQITQTLYEGGRLSAERKRSLAIAEERLAKYSQAVLLAFQEIETTLGNERYLFRQESYLKKAARESLRAEHLALEQYIEELTGIIVYLDAKKRTINAQSALIQVMNQKIQN